MSKAPVYIVCSPHTRTGVTTVTRLLCDFHKVEGRDFALFDTDPNSRTLSELFPETCIPADLSTTRGQIALFDELITPGSQARVIEIPAQNYMRFFSQARDIGLVEEAASRGVELVFLYLTNGTQVAVEAARALQLVWRDVSLIPVLNEGRIKIRQEALDHLDGFGSPQSFQIPALDTSARDAIEQPGFSLSNFLTSPGPDDMSLVVRADLRNWLKRIFTQFRSYQVRKAFEESRYLLRA